MKGLENEKHDRQNLIGAYQLSNAHRAEILLSVILKAVLYAGCAL